MNLDNKARISGQDNLSICIDRSSSTYEKNISLQIYASIFDFADSLQNNIDIACFDTEIIYQALNLNNQSLKIYANRYLRPLPPPPKKGIGKGTNLIVALDWLTNNIINKIQNNPYQRFIGLIFTDDESHKFKEDQLFNKVKDKCQQIKQLNADLIIIQMLPNFNRSSEIIREKLNLNYNQVLLFTDNNFGTNAIYRICSNSLRMITSLEAQRSNSVSDFLIQNKEELLSDNSYKQFKKKESIKLESRVNKFKKWLFG